jgi:hypothetical protein
MRKQPDATPEQIKPNDDLVPYETLVRLTGKRQHAAQARWLKDRKWVFEKNALGHVQVSRAHFERQMGGTAAKKPAGTTEPNWAALGA